MNGGGRLPVVAAPVGVGSLLAAVSTGGLAGASLLGSGGTVTGFATVMIAITVVLVVLGVGALAAVFVADVRADAALRRAARTGDDDGSDGADVAPVVAAAVSGR